MEEKTDEEITFQVQQGQAESFGLLVERYEKKMQRYARKFLFGYDEAEDLVQEVFIKAYVNIKSFDAGRKFSPWIYRIAHNEFINAIKRRGVESVSLFDIDTFFPHLVSDDSADRKTNRREAKEIIDKGIGKLGPKYREVLALYYFEDLSYQEISEVLRLPVATIGVRLKRARDLLEN